MRGERREEKRREEAQWRIMRRLQKDGGRAPRRHRAPSSQSFTAWWASAWHLFVDRRQPSIVHDFASFSLILFYFYLFFQYKIFCIIENRRRRVQAARGERVAPLNGALSFMYVKYARHKISKCEAVMTVYNIKTNIYHRRGAPASSSSLRDHVIFLISSGIMLSICKIHAFCYLAHRLYMYEVMII